MRFIYILTLTVFCPYLLYSQEIFPASFPKELPERFHINLNIDSVDYYSKNSKLAVKNKINSLSYLGQFSHKEIFESGIVGLNYDSIENYLNKIAEKLISKALLEKLNIHIYPSLETEINAYAISDGTILFNLHNFIYLQSEAEVAYIIAHEIGHQISESNSDIEWIDYVIKNRNKNKKNYEKASQNEEINADRRAVDMLYISGYNVNSAVTTEEFFLKLENKRKELVAYTKNGYIKTHPPTQDRLDSAILWTNNENNGENYIIDSTLFRSIKQGSRLHCLKNAMFFHQYFNAFEIAFEGYLTENENAEYPYYIAESLRRLFYSKQINKSKTVYSGIYKGMFQLGLYNIIDKKLFNSKSIESRKLELTNNRVFTYTQLFNYFLKKAIEQNANDDRPILTKGLYNYSLKKKNVEYLNKYIAMGGENSDYIVSLLSPKQKETKPYKSLLVFNQVYASSCTGKKLKYYFLEQSLNEEINTMTKSIYNALCPYEDKKYIYTREDIRTNYDESVFFKNMSMLSVYDYKGKLNLGIVAPEIGQYIIGNGYTTMQYFDVLYQKCTDPGISVIAALGGGVYLEPTRYAISYLMYNSKKKKIKTKQKVTMGKLTAKYFKYNLATFLGEKNYPIK